MGVSNRPKLGHALSLYTRCAEAELTGTKCS